MVLGLHPLLAPIKAAVFPLMKKFGQPEIAQGLLGELRAARIPASYDQAGSIGRRYRRQDEAGTPWCVTIDRQTSEDRTVTIRDRDTLAQERVGARPRGGVDSGAVGVESTEMASGCGVWRRSDSRRARPGLHESPSN